MSANGHVRNVVVITPFDREDEVRALNRMPDEVRAKFLQAEARRQKRERFWLWTAIVSVALAAIPLIAWALRQ